ncbi:MAG: hypothetical protein ACRDLY_10880 [Thermoleophilaceae bacterium]
MTLLASIDRAGDHAMVLGLLVVIAAIGALVYGLVQLLRKRREGRTHAHRGREGAEGPEA